MILIQSGKESDLPFRKEKTVKIIGIVALFIFGITSFDSRLMYLMISGDKYCMTNYLPEENETYINCVYWNTTDFLLSYSSISERSIVIWWLITELHAYNINALMLRPGLSFDTNFSLGIYGLYVIDRVMNQKYFTVRQITYDECAIGQCWTF